jgi:hypothetical protein
VVQISSRSTRSELGIRSFLSSAISAHGTLPPPFHVLGNASRRFPNDLKTANRSFLFLDRA